MLIRLIEGSLFKKGKRVLMCLPAQTKCGAEDAYVAFAALTRKALLCKMLLTTLLIMSVHLKTSASILRADINTFSYSLTHCPVYQIYSQWTGETLVQLTQLCARGDRRGGMGHRAWGQPTALVNKEILGLCQTTSRLVAVGGGPSHFVSKSHKANLSWFTLYCISECCVWNMYDAQKCMQY